MLLLDRLTLLEKYGLKCFLKSLNFKTPREVPEEVATDSSSEEELDE
jgi:hypothetical protein